MKTPKILILLALALFLPGLAMAALYEEEDCQNIMVANKLKYKYCYRDKVKAESELEKLQGQYRYQKSLWEQKESELQQSLDQSKARISELETEKESTQQRLTEQNQELEKAFEMIKEKSGAREQELLQKNQEQKKRYEERIKTLEEALSQLKEECRLERERLTKDLGGRLKTCETARDNLSAELDQLKQLSKDQKNELERMKSQEAELAKQLQREIQQGEIRLKKFHSKLIINIDNRITFDSGSATLKPSAMETFDKISKILSDYPENRLVIEGHTDNVPLGSGRYKDNWELSTQRALSVLRHLLKNAKLDPTRISAAGLGEHQPIVPNDGPENRALNRRVDIVVIPRVK